MSADGTPLPSFQDFVLATKAHKITPSTEILNESAKRSYFLSRMLKGRGNEEIVQTGSSIIDHIQLKKMNNAGFYKPNQNLQPRGVDTLTAITCPWRFHQGNYAWTDQQVELQVASGGNAGDIYTKLKTSWEQAANLDIWDTLEAALWNTPDTTEMEVASGLLPYSIPTFVTDDGLAPAGFTTVSGVDPSTETNWRNQTDTFVWANRATNDVMYQAFDRMWRKMRWKSVRGMNNQTGSPSTNWDKVCIATSMEGLNGYIGVNRSSNDRLRNDSKRANDGGYLAFGDDPTFNNVPIEDVEQLDTNLAPGTPPFYWLNFEYLFPVYHGNKYMDEVGPIRGSINQPFSWAVYKNTYLNLFCRSRKRQGKVATT